MTQIISSKLEILPTQQREYVQLRVGSKAIKDLQDGQVKRYCADVLSKAFFDSGQKIIEPGQDINKILAIQTEVLFSELTGQFKNLTLLELSEAFRRGIRGESGSFFGFCAKTYHQFIKWFYNLPERQKAWTEYLNLSDPEKPTLSLADKMLNSKQSCIRAFEEYKQNKRPPFAAFAFYDIINELIGIEYKGFKTLINDPQKRKDIQTVLKSTYTEKLLKIKIKAEKKGNHNKATEIMAVIASDFKGFKGYENELKEMYLCAFFDVLIQQNKTLEL